MSNQNRISSEIIKNEDGSIYHIAWTPDFASTHVITVGDQNRVPLISQYFDSITHKAAHREFVTHVGTFKGKRIAVISTGIGTDNIDIVLNEIELVTNYDLDTGLKIADHTLNFYRIGTSGALRPEIDTDTIVLSAYGVGLDGLLHYYHSTPDLDEKEIRIGVNKRLHRTLPDIKAYCFKASEKLLSHFSELGREGITLTATGFYGPQGRPFPTKRRSTQWIEDIGEFNYGDFAITNMEMETAAIYGLANIHGHHALSINAILANRVNGTFSDNPQKIVEDTIKKTLDLIVDID